MIITKENTPCYEALLVFIKNCGCWYHGESYDEEYLLTLGGETVAFHKNNEDLSFIMEKTKK